MDKGTKTPDFNSCSSDGKCPLTQKCVNGKCEPVCTSTTCSGETPDCIAQNHAATCKCSDTSCGAGKQCVDGKCETCTVGSRCNCSGEKVIDAAGQCVCPSSVSCSAGQYVSGDCSCKSCQENDTDRNKCGCPGNTVPDGSGSCYCKNKKTCGEGYSFDGTNTCECVPCTDNASCDKPCPEGSFPNGSGCGTYVCTDDSNCAAGNRCENGGTESAQCVPCGQNEQCNCPDGQLSDGSGKCVPVVCKTGLVCSDSVTAQCCDAGMQCVNPDTVESYCAACEVDTQCTCPAGYVVNSAGKCVKPVCAKDGDCANGNKCDNAGKSTATCTPCKEGETCTCTGGMIADGKGGCKFGCEFASAAACKSGTANCTNCALTAGCYVCSACDTWYELSGGSCSPKKCPPSLSTNPTCQAGTYAKASTAYSGSEVCKSCEPCAKGEKCGCPDGKIADGSGACVDEDPCANVSCSGGKVCSKGACVCPSSAPYTDSNGKCQQCLQDSHCGTNQYCYDNGAGTRACDVDCTKICPVGYRNGGRANVLQNGCSNGYVQSGTCNSGRPCWACADAPAQTCSDLGYQDSYGPWTSTCTSGGGTVKNTRLSSGRMCYYCEKGTSCSSMNSSFFEIDTKTCPTGETAIYTGQSANGKSCMRCQATCAKWNLFTQGNGNCPSNQTEVKSTQTGADGACYACVNKTCENSGLTSDPSKSPQPNFVAMTINGVKCYCINCSNSGASSSSGTSSSDSCSSLTSGSIPNGGTVCTKKSDGSFYFSYIKLSCPSTDYSVSQSGVSTSLVSCRCTSKSTYGTSCVQASCTHQYGGTSFTVTGNF